MSASQHHACGNLLIQEGRIGDAILAYRQATRLEPGSARYHLSLADAVARRGWYVLAGGLYCRALELDSEEVAHCQELDLPGPAGPGTEAVFVVGCAHSGTTILTRLLAGLPTLKCAALRETGVVTRVPAEVRQTMGDWDDNCRGGGHRRWLEKSVIHTFLLEKIRAYRPAARVILIVRDGRDVFCSLRRGRQAGCRADQLFKAWVYHNEATRRFWPAPWLRRVRYEDLVSQPAQTLRSLCQWLGEDYPSGLLDYHLERFEWQGVSQRVDQVNRPLFDGRGRWQAEMDESERHLCKRLAQAWLERLGYVEDDNW